jgi:hypothetical protein
LKECGEEFTASNGTRRSARRRFEMNRFHRRIFVVKLWRRLSHRLSPFGDGQEDSIFFGGCQRGIFGEVSAVEKKRDNV